MKFNDFHDYLNQENIPEFIAFSCIIYDKSDTELYYKLISLFYASFLKLFYMLTTRIE